VTLPEDRRPSPFVEFIGARTEEFREGYVRLAIKLEEKHTNPHGVMHGGVITTLMDEALGGVIASVRGVETMMKAPHATVDMNVSFLAGARAGDELIVEGRVLKIGRSVAFGEAEARRRGDDTLIAKGRFTFAIMRREP
jgi:acyl-CoA thioesterase